MQKEKIERSRKKTNIGAVYPREPELFNDLFENGELFIDFGLCNIMTERGGVYRHLKLFFFLVWLHTVQRFGV